MEDKMGFNTANGIWGHATSCNKGVRREGVLVSIPRTVFGGMQLSQKNVAYSVGTVSIPRTVFGGMQLWDKISLSEAETFQYRERYLEACNPN